MEIWWTLVTFSTVGATRAMVQRQTQGKPDSSDQRSAFSFQQE